MNTLQYLCIFVIYHCHCDDISNPTVTEITCSAMDSYLRLTFEGTDYTVLSTQALFPPYAYSIPATPIVTLSDLDNPCNTTQITTNISNTMVLLRTSTECTDHWQTYVAEENGAIAALIASNGNTQNSIPGSEKLYTSIPVRGITKDVADAIVIQSADPRFSFEGTFDCDATDHPLSICVVDTVGDLWYLDGEYIHQTDETYNDHPIWQKPGYYVLNYYIFLHTANRSSEWFWAITRDSSYEDDSGIRAYCSVGGDDIKEPSDCPLWRTRNTSNIGQLDTYIINNNLTVSAHVCIYADDYICVDSTQSSLAGVRGTYRLNHKNIPIWFRETDECDSTPGMMGLASDGSLVIKDAEDAWTVAICDEGNNVSFAPQSCTSWRTLDDNSLDNLDLSTDDTLIITQDKCDTVPCDITDEAPDTLCLSNNTVLHAYVEGTYIKTGVTGDNTVHGEYMKKDIAYDDDGNPIELYLWYFGEFSETYYPWWVLSPRNLTWAKNNVVIYYAYVACSVENIANCNAPWNFYWDVTNAAHSDASFQVTEGDCPATTTPSIPAYDNEYEYICFDIEDENAFTSQTSLDPDVFRGGYYKTIDPEDDIPYWTKPVNDETDIETYIWYDNVHYRWHIDISLSTRSSTGMVCMSRSLYPEQCDTWYDTLDGRRLSHVFTLNVDECVYDDVLRRSCSAMHSWLQLSGHTDTTVTSTQTLFPPYSYRVNPTEIIRLNPKTDDPCSIDTVTTDVSGKMVLLFTTQLFSTPACSDHYQLYVMEQLGAVAAIMSMRDNSLEAIVDDDSMNTSIPMRGITLIKALDIATILDDGFALYGEFNCNDSFEYPLTICAARVGLEIYGNFEYQTQQSYKEHPVWIREGYSYYTAYADTYLYLHDAYGDNEWYWAITMDPQLSDDDDMIAYCKTGTSVLPTDCPEWLVISSGWDVASDLMLYPSLCNVSDNYFCITSQQSSLAGFEGTYRLYYDNEPVWFREQDACDSGAAVFAFSYEDSMFYLLDTLDDWIVASCYIGERLPWLDSDEWEEYEEHYAFHPELCAVWYTLDDGILSDDQSYDATLNVESETVCLDDECIEDGNTQSPDSLCLLQNSVMHSFLEGEYVQTGVVGDVYETPEYIRSDKLYYDGDALNVYLWFYGEVPDRTPWWIISNHNMSKGLEQGFAIAYGYVACSLSNVANCQGPWNFYYGTQVGEGSWHSDAQFDMMEGECTKQETFAANYTDEYEYLCIDIVDDDDDDDGYEGADINVFRGGYKMNRTSTAFSGDTPFWVKPPNDYTKQQMYIYYDEFYGYWQIGSALRIKYSLICMDDTPYPDECGKWYDNKSILMTDVIALRIEGCTYTDVLNVTSDFKHNGAMVAVVVILVIVLMILLCVAAYCLYDKLVKDRRSESGYGYNRNSNDNTVRSTEMGTKKKKTKGGHTQLAIGSDEEDGDNEDGALTQGNTQSGYDMNPLERDKSKSDSNHVDQQENDIDDDEDEDEDGILMTKH